MLGKFALDAPQLPFMSKTIFASEMMLFWGLTDCSHWRSYSPQNSLNGISYPQFITVADCLALCRSKPDCVAVDFDDTTQPCYIHTNSDDLLPINTYFLAGRTQYRIDRTCTADGMSQLHNHRVLHNGDEAARRPHAFWSIFGRPFGN